jgi:hypothetical protein
LNNAKECAKPRKIDGAWQFTKIPTKPEIERILTPKETKVTNLSRWSVAAIVKGNDGTLFVL